jgi:hypothetical protein
MWFPLIEFCKKIKLPFKISGNAIIKKCGNFFNDFLKLRFWRYC